MIRQIRQFFPPPIFSHVRYIEFKVSYFTTFCLPNGLQKDLVPLWLVLQVFSHNEGNHVGFMKLLL